METEEMRRTEATSGLSRGSADAGFLSRSEVAGLFGVSLSTVTRWARTGLLPAVRSPAATTVIAPRTCAD